MMQRKRTLWLVLLAIVLMLTACTGQTDTTAQTGEVVTAFIGDLTASATATGHISAERTAALAITQPGKVTDVYVQIGDSVMAGDPLVQLDTAELALSVTSAEQTLRLQEANLTSLQEPANETDVAAATANVTSAQANLDNLLAGPTPQQLAVYSATVAASEASLYSASAQYQSAANSVSEAQIQQAEAAVLSAQVNYNRAQEINADNPNEQTHEAMIAAASALANAQSQLDNLLNTDTSSAQGSLAAANARLDGSEADYLSNTSGATAAQIASAEAQLAQAQATLDDLLVGPTEAELQTAQAQVEQARLSLTDAQETLAKATLTAPFAGIVTAVHVSAGEYASGVAIELMDMANLEVTVPVDEVDIGVIEVGQKATITLETWPDVAIESEVALVAPGAAANSSLVTYDVHLRLGQTDLPVRVGMTANVQLITAQRTDILLLPNQAIQVDRENGTYSVNRVNGDAIEVVEVTIGLRDGQNTQITGGLEEGDEVRIGNDLPTFEFGPGGGEQ